MLVFLCDTSDVSSICISSIPLILITIYQSRMSDPHYILGSVMMFIVLPRILLFKFGLTVTRVYSANLCVCVSLLLLIKSFGNLLASRVQLLLSNTNF